MKETGSPKELAEANSHFSKLLQASGKDEAHLRKMIAQGGEEKKVAMARAVSYRGPSHSKERGHSKEGDRSARRVEDAESTESISSREETSKGSSSESPKARASSSSPSSASDRPLKGGKASPTPSMKSPPKSPHVHDEVISSSSASGSESSEYYQYDSEDI